MSVANWKLLLHCNGENGSTSFPDASLSNHSVTANGNAQVSNSLKKFGTGSCSLDGTGDYLSLADDSDWNFGTGDFTLDCWIYYSGTLPPSQTKGIIGASLTGGGSGIGWNLWINTSRKVVFSKNYGYSGQVLVNSITSINQNTWYHVAITRNGDNLRIFIDGDLEATTTGVSATTFNSGGTGITIGRFYPTYNDFYFQGYIDEIRIIKGEAIWTSDFDVPTEEYDIFENVEINETIILTEDWTIQPNPDLVEIGEEINLQDEWILTTNPETLDINEEIKIQDDWTFQTNPDILNLEKTLGLSDNWTVNPYLPILNAWKVISYNPLVVINNYDPVTVSKIDITDPDNPVIVNYPIDASGETIKNAKDIVFNTTFDLLYIACADGKILKIDITDFNSREEIDTSDTNNFQKIVNLDNFHRIFASTDDNTGEIIVLDHADIFSINTDFRINVPVLDLCQLSLSWLEASQLHTDIRFLTINQPTCHTDIRFFPHIYSEIAYHPIARTDFKVYLDNILVDDVQLSSINIYHAVDQKSSATFILARKHDHLNYTLEGTYSQITNQNEVKIYIKDYLEFQGNISEILANSQTETVQITALATQKPTDKTTISVPMASLNETIHPYQVKLNNPTISNPVIDINDENPEYYKGIKVNLGTYRKQRTLTDGVIADFPADNNDVVGAQALGIYAGLLPFSGYSGGLFIPLTLSNEIFGVGGVAVGKLATAYMAGTFKPRQNWTYFWTNILGYQFEKGQQYHFNYVGTSLAGFTSDIWQLIQINYQAQRTLDDIVSGRIRPGTSSGNGTIIYEDLEEAPEDDEIQEASYYLIGEAPYQEISVQNGQFFPDFRLVDNDDGLYIERDEGYDYVPYCIKVADLEYEKLKNINGTILPRTTVNLEFSIDAYYYYKITLLKRLNIANTTTSNIYTNQNGFPVSVKAITINAQEMIISLTTDNEFSRSELLEIDALYPDVEDYIQPFKSYFKYQKSDPARFEDVK